MAAADAAREATKAIVLEYLLKLGAVGAAELLDERFGDGTDTRVYERLQSGLTASDGSVLEAMCVRALKGRGGSTVLLAAARRESTTK